jgi:hypothetical protein
VAAVLTAGSTPRWRLPALAVARAVLRGDDVTGTVAALVGRGAGLTPSGDDVLCGLLLGLRPVPRSHGRLWAAVVPRLPATTSLSAALLVESAQGYAVPPVLRLGHTLGTGPDAPGERELQAAVREVVAIGHSSGADLLAGLAAALQVVTEPARTAAPPTSSGGDACRGLPAATLATNARLPAGVPA